jgi:hypothetical protein
MKDHRKTRTSSGWSKWKLPFGLGLAVLETAGERRKEMTKAHVLRLAAIAVMALTIAGVAGTTREAAAALPPGNTVAQWNKIA